MRADSARRQLEEHRKSGLGVFALPATTTRRPGAKDQDPLDEDRRAVHEWRQYMTAISIRFVASSRVGEEYQAEIPAYEPTLPATDREDTP